MIKCIYYHDHDKRYKHFPPRVRKEYPDEVHLVSTTVMTIIKRERNLDEFTKEDFRRYGHDFRIAAKDIPLSRALPKESY